MSPGTVKNYKTAARLLGRFCIEKKFNLRIKVSQLLNRRETQGEKNYWKKFYKKYSDFLYLDCGHFDNYVGQKFKCLRTFCHYLNKELAPGIGDFGRIFYTPNQESTIYPLMLEELNYLIYDEQFELSLTPHLRRVKDLFVFVCTVGLRISDLFGLKRTNIRIIKDNYFLTVRSKKTSVDTLIQLPDYAIKIMINYLKTSNQVFPKFTQSNLNKSIKQLIEKAGFTH